MQTIDHYAVFGYPIGHSKSPRIHRLFAQQTGQDLEYAAVAVPADTFSASVSAFLAGGGKGLNCTIPLKELAWQRAEQLTERARLAKAVNTLALQTDGTLLGDNTDGFGLANDLTRNHQVKISGTRILVLGAGGATRGILSALFGLAPDSVLLINRTVEKADNLAQEFCHLGPIRSGGYADLHNLSGFDLIINATASSLSNELPPLPDHVLRDGGVCYDLAYGNQPTAFVRWGQTHGAAKSVDGLGMLVEQAAEAFRLWRGLSPDTAAVINLLNRERNLHASES
ncbi:shikimate dehydrogenase [Methylomonas sp. HYX-M1]|uniref:shikimate dehydrogenase n=1 Tax=Methylomonas sp. HYX-M1 TaxID=3139307 RepID=UPI00345BA28E